MKNKAEFNAYAIGELLFILLPFLVMVIIFAYRERINELLFQPEFSLTSSVIAGQIIIKLIHIIGKTRTEIENIKIYSISTFIAAVIVFLLVPSLLIFSILSNSKSVPLWLIIVQTTIFVITLSVFFLINQVQAEIENKMETKKHTK